MLCVPFLFAVLTHTEPCVESTQSTLQFQRVAKEETEAKMGHGAARGLVEEEEVGVLPKQLAFLRPPGCWLQK